MDILITGVSSGIGLKLTKQLVGRGHRVFGIARREQLLVDLKLEIASENFQFLSVDISKTDAWDKISDWLKKKKSNLEVVIFNAGVLEQDLNPTLNYHSLAKTHQINFLSVMEGLAYLFKISRKCHFIAISSIAALRGSSVEGVGYASSKSALSIAFEAFFQKFKNSQNYHFSLIYFGPVAGGMSPFKSKTPFQINQDRAAWLIEKVIKEKDFEYSSVPFLVWTLRVIRIFPPTVTFGIFSLIENLHKKFQKRS